MNEKYRDAILIQNLAFLEVTINSRSASSSFPALASLLEESSQKLFEAEKNYLDWMIEYEMPSFWSLSKKIDGVEKRANREELSIYVRRYVERLSFKSCNNNVANILTITHRQDVIKVMSGLSAKSVEASISVMRKRLDKHFGSSEASVRKLCEDIAILFPMFLLLYLYRNSVLFLKCGQHLRTGFTLCLFRWN